LARFKLYVVTGVASAGLQKRYQGKIRAAEVITITREILLINAGNIIYMMGPGEYSFSIGLERSLFFYKSAVFPAGYSIDLNLFINGIWIGNKKITKPEQVQFKNGRMIWVA